MSELIADWRTYLSTERGLAPATIKLYVRYIETLQKDLGDTAALSTDDLRGWLHSKGGSAGTVSNRITALKGYYSFLFRSGVVPKDPALPLEPPRGRGAPRGPVENLDEVLSELDEVDRKANLWSVAQRRVGESRDMAVFLAETGLRINEAVACRWPVPCPSEGVVRKGRKETRVEVSPEAQEAWNRLGGKWPNKARATQRRFEKAGFHPHQLRHWHRANMSGPRQGLVSSASVRSTHGADEGTMRALDEITRHYSREELAIVHGFLTKLVKALPAR